MSTLKTMVVVVTGAGRGIGCSIAKELEEAGARVVVNYHQSVQEAENFVEALNRLNPRMAIAVRADVSDPPQAQKLIAQAIETFGRIDVLVNNAGITRDRSLKNLSIEDWNQVLQVNLNSVYYMVRAAIPHFIQQKSGKIISISSFTAQSGNFGQANYTAAKAGIIGFTKTAAIELARYNITANVICPGFIETDMFTQMPEEAKSTILQKIPLRRLGQPQEVARAVRYLIEDGDYITGQTLNINGGIYM